MVNIKEIEKFGETAKKVSPTIVMYQLLEKLPRVEPHLVETYTKGMLNLLEIDERLNTKNKK